GSDIEGESMEAAAVPTVDVADRAPSAVVAAHDITRRYGEGDTAVDALRGVSLDVQKGKLTAVMGPSGSGKSTLMHIMAALDRPRVELAPHGRLCQRADRQPRVHDGRRDPRAATWFGRDARPDDGDGHARPVRSRDRRPDPVPRRRGHRP